MGDGRGDAAAFQLFCQIFDAGKLRRRSHHADAVPRIEQRAYGILFDGIYAVLALRSFLCRREERSLQMDAEDGGKILPFGRGLYRENRLLQQGKRGCERRRQDGGSPMCKMRFAHLADPVGGTVHHAAAASAVDVDIDKAGG